MNMSSRLDSSRILTNMPLERQPVIDSGVREREKSTIKQPRSLRMHLFQDFICFTSKHFLTATDINGFSSCGVPYPLLVKTCLTSASLT